MTGVTHNRVYQPGPCQSLPPSKLLKNYFQQLARVVHAGTARPTTNLAQTCRYSSTCAGVNSVHHPGCLSAVSGRMERNKNTHSALRAGKRSGRHCGPAKPSLTLRNPSTLRVFFQWAPVQTCRAFISETRREYIDVGSVPASRGLQRSRKLALNTFFGLW